MEPLLSALNFTPSSSAAASLSLGPGVVVSVHRLHGHVWADVSVAVPNKTQLARLTKRTVARLSRHPTLAYDGKIRRLKLFPPWRRSDDATLCSQRAGLGTGETARRKSSSALRDTPFQRMAGVTGAWTIDRNPTCLNFLSLEVLIDLA